MTDDVSDRVPSDRVLVDIRDGIADVRLNRPAKYNGLDLPLLRGLAAAAHRLRGHREVRVVVLSGEGPAFCAGLDFASVGRASVAAQLRAIAKLPGGTNLFQEACWAWRRLPVPVIAVLHGHCFGGGLQLALAADFRIATPDCELSVMEARWGLIPDMTGSVTLRELVPADLAKRLTMTAEIFEGRRALEWGLVTEIADRPRDRADELAAQLAARSPDALAYAKRLFDRTWTRSPRWAFWTETVLQARLLAGPNARIARKAGLARETPVYRPRSVR